MLVLHFQEPGSVLVHSKSPNVVLPEACGKHAAIAAERKQGADLGEMQGWTLKMLLGYSVDP